MEKRIELYGNTINHIIKNNINPQITHSRTRINHNNKIRFIINKQLSKNRYNQKTIKILKMDFSDLYNDIKKRSENLENLSLKELKELLHDAKEIQTQYNNLQLVVKRNANSLYGVSASIYFSLVDYDIAEDITTSGKMFAVIVDVAINNFFKNWGETELKIIREFYPNTSSLRKFTEYVPETENDLCVYGDTDSRYVSLDMIYSLIFDENNKPMKLPQSNEELSNFAVFLQNKFIAKIIKETIDAECERRNARKGFLKMAHEVTTRKCVFQKKKKYIMVSVWEDGKLLNKPKIKMRGVELKRGETSKKAKKIITKLLNLFLVDNYTTEQLRDETIKFIKYIQTKKDKELVYQISSVSGIKNITKTNNSYTSDKNHIQMQIALSWANFVSKNNLQNQFKVLPFDGQKMNYYYTKDKKQKLIGIPDDVSINSVPNLPEPDWQEMMNRCIVKPLLRYIDEDEVDDATVNNFLFGVKKLKF